MTNVVGVRVSPWAPAMKQKALCVSDTGSFFFTRHPDPGRACPFPVFLPLRLLFPPSDSKRKPRRNRPGGFRLPRALPYRAPFCRHAPPPTLPPRPPEPFPLPLRAVFASSSATLPPPATIIPLPIPPSRPSARRPIISLSPPFLRIHVVVAGRNHGAAGACYHQSVSPLKKVKRSETAMPRHLRMPHYPGAERPPAPPFVRDGRPPHPCDPGPDRVRGHALDLRCRPTMHRCRHVCP